MVETFHSSRNEVMTLEVVLSVFLPVTWAVNYWGSSLFHYQLLSILKGSWIPVCRDCWAILYFLPLWPSFFHQPVWPCLWIPLFFFFPYPKLCPLLVILWWWLLRPVCWMKRAASANPTSAFNPVLHSVGLMELLPCSLARLRGWSLLALVPLRSAPIFPAEKEHTWPRNCLPKKF